MILQDLIRRVSNLLREGVVSEVDYDKARVKVRMGRLNTRWLPFFARRAGNTIDWDPPEVGEQCLVLSPGGELGGGFVLTGIYSNAHPAPSKSQNIRLQKYADGLECQYDQESHTLTISRPDELNVKVKATKLDFQTNKVSIKNEQCELLGLISGAIDSIAKSKTATMMGPRELLPAAMELPLIKQKLDSFGG